MLFRNLLIQLVSAPHSYIIGMVFSLASVLIACSPPAFTIVPTEVPISAPHQTATKASFTIPKSLIASIEALPPLALHFTLNRPDAAFLQKLAFPAFGPQSPANLERYGGGGDLMRNPIGTGPYRFVEWVQGDAITLERNPDYWGRPPLLDTITYRVIKDPTARFLELRAGAVDGIDNLSPDDLPAAQADPSLQVFTRPPLNIGYLGINRAHEPFDDLQVRQAIALAIDKETLVQALYPPAAQVATQFAPPGVFGHSDALAGWPHDPARAARLLAEAGYPNGFATTLWIMGIGRPYFPFPDRVGEALQADLAAVGIDAEIVVYDWGTYLDKVFAGEADLFLNGWLADFPDASNFLDTFFGAGADSGLGPKFPELVALLHEAGAASDAAQRQALYDQANQFIHDHVPAAPIVHNSTAIAFRADVQGVQPNPFNQEQWASVSMAGKNRLIFARGGDSVGLDPADEIDFESLMVTAQIFEPLVRFKPGTFQIEPWLAERWEVSDDLKTWTFHLRPGVRFHDGTELDAEAVALNFRRWWDREHPYHVGHLGNFFHWSFYFGGFKSQ